MRLGIGLMMLLALATAPAAASTLTVEGVVSPAWVERGGARLPLEVGMALKDKDSIHTGPGSRALLRMADYDRLRAAGYPAVIHPVAREGAVEYRVRIVNVPSERDARAVVEKLKSLGMTEAAVSR